MLLSQEKEEIFAKIKEINNNAKKYNYKDMTVEQMLKVLNNYKNKSNKYKKQHNQYDNDTVNDYDEYEILNPDYDTDESMEYKTHKGLEYFNDDETLKSYDIDERQLKTEGIHLTAYVKNPYDTAQPNRIFTIEDSDYNSKQQFKSDLKSNGYIVKSIADDRDLYIVDNSNYRNLADAEKDLRKYKQWQKDTRQHSPDSTLWQSNIDEIQELVDNAKKISLTENKIQKIESKHKVEEVSRNELLAKSKSQTITRYKKSAAYKGFYIVDIDTTSVFTTNCLRVTCKVGDYWDTVEMQNILYWIQIEAEKNDNRQINTKGVTAAIMNSIDGMDIKVDCTCGDWCLEENTEIKLLNGKVVTVKEMKDMFNNKEELWVYSTDELGDFKPGKVEDVWITGYTKDMVKVTLDNGREIITTPSHKYMMRDGSYKEAKDLKELDSLMPLYFSYTNGYENVKRNSIVYPTKFDSVYKTVANTVLEKEKQEAMDRTGEDIIQIHHRDFNKLNNYPSNLYPMGKMEHWYYHSKLGGKNVKQFIESGKRFWIEDPRRFEALKRQKQKAREYQLNMWANFTPEEKQAYLSKNIQKRSIEQIKLDAKKIWDNYTPEEKEDRLNTSNTFRTNNPMLNEEFLSSDKMKERNKKISEGLKKFHSTTTSEQRSELYGWAKGKTFTQEHKDNIRKSLQDKPFTEEHIRHLSEGGKRQAQQNKESRCRRNLDELIQQGIEITPESFLSNRKPGDAHYLKVFTSFEEMLEKFNIPYNINHKVKSIEFIHYNEEIPVYDISVKDYHNFYVDAGVMLHNCYRFAYQATKFGYKYGKPETRPAKITNPNDYGAMCKHLISMLSNKRWLQQVTSTVMDFIEKRIDDVNKRLKLYKDDEKLTLPNELARYNAKASHYARMFKDLEDKEAEEAEKEKQNQEDNKESEENDNE